MHNVFLFSSGNLLIYSTIITDSLSTNYLQIYSYISDRSSGILLDINNGVQQVLESVTKEQASVERGVNEVGTVKLRLDDIASRVDEVGSAVTETIDAAAKQGKLIDEVTTS